MKHRIYLAFVAFGCVGLRLACASCPIERNVPALVSVRQQDLQRNERQLIDDVLLNDALVGVGLRNIPNDGSNRTVLQRLIVQKSEGLIPEEWDGHLESIPFEPLVDASRTLLYVVRAVREYCIQKNLNFADYVNHQDSNGNTALGLFFNDYVHNALQALFWMPPMGAYPDFTPEKQTQFGAFFNNVKLIINVLTSGGAALALRNRDNRTPLENFMVFKVLDRSGIRTPMLSGTPKLRLKSSGAGDREQAYAHAINIVVDALERGGLNLDQELNNALRAVGLRPLGDSWFAYTDYIAYLVLRGAQITMNAQEFSEVLRRGSNAPEIVLQLTEISERYNDKNLRDYLCRTISKDDVEMLIQNGVSITKKFLSDFFATCPATIEEGMEAAYPERVPVIPREVSELIQDYAMDAQ